MFCNNDSLTPLQLRLFDQESKHDKWSVVYKYNPPVLILGATWHEKRVSYARSLYYNLQLAYSGHEEFVRSNTITHS
jgi:hypothetical protein